MGGKLSSIVGADVIRRPTLSEAQILIEVMGVASIFPFLAVLSNPAAVQVDAYLGVAYDALGFTSTNSFLLFLGIVVLVILFLRIASEALTQSWIMYWPAPQSGTSL